MIGIAADFFPLVLYLQYHVEPLGHNGSKADSPWLCKRWKRAEGKTVNRLEQESTYGYKELYPTCGECFCMT